MPVVPFGDNVFARATTDFADKTGAIPVKVRFAETDRVTVGFTALGLRGFLAGLMARFMALAPVRSANRAMALSERWNDRLKIATYRCLAHDALSISTLCS
jgi:hypothetical protein